jgi:hypothetical protein
MLTLQNGEEFLIWRCDGKIGELGLTVASPCPQVTPVTRRGSPK